MATIASLSVSVKADVEQFLTALGKVRKSLKGMASDLPFANTNITKLGLVAATAAGAGIALLTKNSMDAIDKVAKLSDSLGISTENLTGLQHAAGLAGIAEDQLSGAMKKLGKEMGMALAGDKKAAEGFENLGLSMDDLKGKSVDQVFSMIADEVSNLEDPTQRAAAAVDIFGKSGVDLIPLLLSGSEGIAQMTAENAKLGGSFSRIDAAQVELANDAMTKLEKVITGAANKLAIELSPFILAAVDHVVALATEGEGMGAIVTNAFNYVLQAIGTVADYLELVKAGFYTLRGVWTTGLQIMITPVVMLIRMLDDLLSLVGQGNSDIRVAADEFHQGFGIEAAQAFKDADEALRKFSTNENSGKIQLQFKGIQDRAGAAAKKIADAAEANKGFAEPVNKDLIKFFEDLDKAALKVFEDTRTPLEKFAEKITELQELFAFDAIDEDTFARAIAKAEDEARKAMDKDKKKETKIGSFKTVDLSRISLAGLSMGSETKVKDPQLEKTNLLLTEIKAKVGVSGAVAQ